MENYENTTGQMLYQTNDDDTARFVIGQTGSNPLIVMSINPSIGSPERSTPTLGTVKHVAKAYGYNGWIVLSLYPQRATHLDELAESADPALIEENNKVIAKVFSMYPGASGWAAWGTHYDMRSYFPQCLEQIAGIASEYGMSWMSYGPLDADGNPRYCLYLEPGEDWHVFDMQAYLEQNA